MNRGTRGRLSTQHLSHRVREYYRKRAVKDGSVAEYDEWSQPIHAALDGIEDIDTAFVWHVLAIGRDWARAYDQLYGLKGKRTVLFPEKTPQAQAAILRAARTLLRLGWPRAREAFGRELQDLAWCFYVGLEFLEARLTEVTVESSEVENPALRRLAAPEWDAELTACIVCLMEAFQRVPKRERWVAELLEVSRLFRVS